MPLFTSDAWLKQALNNLDAPPYGAKCNKLIRSQEPEPMPDTL